MAYATNDGVNRYQTADGQIFTNEMDAQAHANSLDSSGSLGVALGTRSGVDQFLQAERYEEQGRLNDAISSYTSSIKFFESNANANKDVAISYLRRGQVYFKLKQYNNAIKDFEETIGQKGFSETTITTRQSAYGQLGDSYKSLGQVEKAIEAYKKATDLGHPNTASIIAWLQNPANAEQVKARCTSSSSSPSAEELYEQGTEAYNAEDYAKAVELFRKSADMGNDNAQDSIGNCYYNGQGVPQDYKKAVEWYRKSAEQGNMYAQYDLGNSLFDGNGIPQNEAEAVKWWIKSAEQGYDIAQNDLGYSYHFGEGVKQDYAKAFEWYTKAAAQGNSDAENNLGYLYHHGQGVKQDYAKAKEWYQKAAAQGHEKAKEHLQEISPQMR